MCKLIFPTGCSGGSRIEGEPLAVVSSGAVAARERGVCREGIEAKRVRACLRRDTARIPAYAGMSAATAGAYRRTG